MVLGGQVLAVPGEIEPGVGFAVLSITIGQFTKEMGFVSALGPGFAEVSTHGAG
jgi:hypothetical protein